MIQQYMQYYLGRVLGDKKGVSSLEYAVLAVGIVLVVAVAATNLGTALSTVFGKIDSAV